MVKYQLEQSLSFSKFVIQMRRILSMRKIQCLDLEFDVNYLACALCVTCFGQMNKFKLTVVISYSFLQCVHIARIVARRI